MITKEILNLEILQRYEHSNDMLESIMIVFNKHTIDLSADHLLENKVKRIAYDEYCSENPEYDYTVYDNKVGIQGLHKHFTVRFPNVYKDGVVQLDMEHQLDDSRMATIHVYDGDILPNVGIGTHTFEIDKLRQRLGYANSKKDKPNE